MAERNLGIQARHLPCPGNDAVIPFEHFGRAQHFDVGSERGKEAGESMPVLGRDGDALPFPSADRSGDHLIRP